jgi:hypothetical protein
MLVAAGIEEPESADLEAFATFIRRKAVLGLLFAIVATGAFIILFHLWKLPPFDWK